MEPNKCPLLAELNQIEISALKAIAHRTVLEAGTWAFHEGEPGDSLVIVFTGTLRITKKAQPGEEEELALLGSGDYLGEMALFGQKARAASGQALERTEVAIVPYDTLLALLDANPPTAAKFYKAMCAGMAKRLHGVNGNVAFLKAYLKTRDS